MYSEDDIVVIWCDDCQTFHNVIAFDEDQCPACQS